MAQLKTIFQPLCGSFFWTPLEHELIERVFINVWLFWFSVSKLKFYDGYIPKRTAKIPLYHPNKTLFSFFSWINSIVSILILLEALLQYRWNLYPWAKRKRVSILILLEALLQLEGNTAALARYGMFQSLFYWKLFSNYIAILLPIHPIPVSILILLEALLQSATWKKGSRHITKVSILILLEALLQCAGFIAAPLRGDSFNPYFIGSSSPIPRIKNTV